MQMNLRWTFRRIPGRFGFIWWQFAIVPSVHWWWNEPQYRGIVRTTRLGPFWFASMRKG